MTFEALCSVFGAKGTSDTRKCRCPAHDDRKASMSITRGSDGKTLIHCHTNTCGTEDILRAKGLKLSDLYEGKTPSAASEPWKAYVEGTVSRRNGHAVKIEAQYDYLDPDGNYAYTKLRMTGKEMVYGILKDGRFSFGLGGRTRREWNAVFTKSVQALREIASCGGEIFYAEGEKDVLTIQKQGLLAVTAGGCEDWHKDLAPLFAGANVIVCADNDAPGQRLSERIRQDAFRFLVLTGLRRGELCGLMNEDITENMLTIRRSINTNCETTSGKNDNARRSFLLSSEMKRVLKEQREYAYTGIPDRTVRGKQNWHRNRPGIRSHYRMAPRQWIRCRIIKSPVP